MDILDELKLKTHNCVTPSWATRAAQEIDQMRNEMAILRSSRDYILGVAIETLYENGDNCPLLKLKRAVEILGEAGIKPY